MGQNQRILVKQTNLKARSNVRVLSTILWDKKKTRKKEYDLRSTWKIYACQGFSYLTIYDSMRA